MRIAVNTRLLLKNKLEGIGRFSLETLSRIAISHPEHEFIFIFDRPYDKKFIFSQNIIPVVIGPQARHPFLFVLWFEISIPWVMKKYKADILLSPDGFLSLRCKKTCIVVDHDLLFIDYITNKLLVFDGEPAIHGESKGPFSKSEGMNIFLKDLGITFRRDADSKRPRANKAESQLDREMRDYIRNQERSSMPPPPNRDSSRIRSFSSSLFGGSHRSKGTYWLMGLNGLFSLAGLILGLFRVSSAVLFLNVSTLFGNFWIWTLFTSMFTTTNVFSLIFTMIILYGTGRMLENQFGTRFILYLYIGCGLFGIVGGLFFQAIFSFLPILPQANALGFQLSLFSVQWAALLGMISYILYMVGLNREMRMYLYFIPM